MALLFLSALVLRGPRFALLAPDPGEAGRRGGAGVGAAPEGDALGEARCIGGSWSAALSSCCCWFDDPVRGEAGDEIVTGRDSMAKSSRCSARARATCPPPCPLLLRARAKPPRGRFVVVGGAAAAGGSSGRVGGSLTTSTSLTARRAFATGMAEKGAEMRQPAPPRRKANPWLDVFFLVVSIFGDETSDER